MRRALTTAMTTAVLVLVLAVPALAGTPGTTGAGGAGQDFGRHHATMAREMGGLTGHMNPGVHHQGFSNWDPSMSMP
jgi:hypothetical protein